MTDNERDHGDAPRREGLPLWAILLIAAEALGWLWVLSGWRGER